MVECECGSIAISKSYSKVLIDTWWNVNIFLDFEIAVYNVVLIDTWWNVNINHHINVIKVILVLIDTWWNVNTVIVL